MYFTLPQFPNEHAFCVRLAAFMEKLYQMINLCMRQETFILKDILVSFFHFFTNWSSLFFLHKRLYIHRKLDWVCYIRQNLFIKPFTKNTTFKCQINVFVGIKNELGGVVLVAKKSFLYHYKRCALLQGGSGGNILLVKIC